MIAAAPTIVRILFWALALAVVVAPRRWSLLAYLVIIQVDVSGPGWASPSAVGLENALKVGLLPLILLARAGFAPLTVRWGRPLQLWALLTGYAALASLWSPYPLSALKMVVYLLGYGVVFLVLSYAWSTGWLNLRQVVAALWLSLLLACVQTYLLGNPFGTPPKIMVEPARFTTFAPPQFFAAYLAATGALLLLAHGQVKSRREQLVLLASGAATGVALLLAASRYVLIGVAALLAVALAVRLVARAPQRVLPVSARSLLLAAVALVIIVGSVAWLKPDNRVFALRKLVANGQFNPNAIGTFRWRLQAYRTAIHDIERRGPRELIFGSGTSSAARVVLEFDAVGFPAATLDSNRALHDEFLRALYEWGVIGALIFLAFCASVVVGFVRMSRRDGVAPVLVFWAFLPTLVLGLTLENVLAGSGTPVGTGVLLVLSYAAVAGLRPVYGQERFVARALRPQPLPTARG